MCVQYIYRVNDDFDQSYLETFPLTEQSSIYECTVCIPFDVVLVFVFFELVPQY